MSPTPTISAATKHSKAARMMGQVEPRRSTRAPIVRPMNMSEYAKAPVSIFSPLPVGGETRFALEGTKHATRHC